MGTYITNILPSDTSFNKSELIYYQGITLDLFEDGGFTLSKSVPFGESRQGKWVMRGNDLERDIRLQYSTGHWISINYCDTIGALMYIKVPVYDKGALPIRKIK